MQSWGFALREGMFAETKDGICRNKDLKRLALKVQEESAIKCRTASRTSGCNQVDRIQLIGFVIFRLSEKKKNEQFNKYIKCYKDDQGDISDVQLGMP